MKVFTARTASDDYTMPIQNLSRSQKAEIMRFIVYSYCSDSLTMELASDTKSKASSSVTPGSPPPAPGARPRDYPKSTSPPSPLDLEQPMQA